MHLLCCDWLLSSRSYIWEKEALDEGNHAPDATKLDSFDKDLKSLQKICLHVPEALPKVYQIYSIVDTYYNYNSFGGKLSLYSMVDSS